MMEIAASLQIDAVDRRGLGLSPIVSYIRLPALALLQLNNPASNRSSRADSLM
jgi:hypothetical protein